MQPNIYRTYTLYVALILLFTNCRNNTTTPPSTDVSSLPKASPAQIEKLVAQFIEAKEGSTILMSEGYYELNTQLILDNINKVTIKGAGMHKTVLSFKTLTTGGEGMKIAGNNILLEDFTVRDAPGDDIKTQKCDGLTFRGVNTTWTHSDLSKSGTYGIYPVDCKNVLIEKCEVSNSRDAGIYVGQSSHIIVRDNYVHESVAGIEIENSDDADVYNNKAINNTAGILIFNLPGLPKAAGSRTKVYNNIVKENNHVNFAIASNTQNGSAITMIPPGSGIIVLAGNDVEIFNNQIIHHKTVGVSVINYQLTELEIPNHPGWSPYSTNVYVHDNTYERDGSFPDMSKDLGKLISAKCLQTQDVVYDGIIDAKKGTDPTKNPMNICIKEKKEDLRFARFVFPDNGGLMGIKVVSDVTNFNNCTVDVKTDKGKM